jgi:hemerythrin-like domain-containing protein
MAAHQTDQVDTSAMVLMHDAFRRDLVHLANSTARYRGDDPARLSAQHAGWEIFKTQLHIHHTAEDTGLWPHLRVLLIDRPDDLALLDAMEAEHARIDPLLAGVDAALAGAEAGADRLAGVIDALVVELSSHLGHEEREALPLIARTISAADWERFGNEQRRSVGIKGAAQFLPWLLDSQDPERAGAMLGNLPAPLRLVYRRIWRPRYVKLNPWAAS